MLAATDVDQWARAEAVPSAEEITRIRQLITQIENGLDDLVAAEREQISPLAIIGARTLHDRPPAVWWDVFVPSSFVNSSTRWAPSN